MESKPGVFKWGCLWLALAVVIGSLVGSLNLPLYERLAANGIQAQAIVVELTPQIHGTVIYEYQVDGRKYERQRAPSRPNPVETKVGQPLVIYYDPLNPALSEPGDPKLLLSGEIAAVALATLCMPTFIVLVLVLRLRAIRERRKVAI